jgi:hypothetical protein
MVRRRRKRKGAAACRPREGPAEAAWMRCGAAACGRLVRVPPDPRGHACPKCGAPLSWARDP